MRTYRKWRQGIAVSTAALLFTGSSMSLSGCGETSAPDSFAAAEEEEQENQTETSEDQSSEKNVAMGRYLEEDLVLPEDCNAPSSLEILDDGVMRLCYRNVDWEMMYADSDDNGASWGESVKIDELLGMESGAAYYVQLAKDGGIFVHVPETDPDSDEMDPDYTHRYFYIDPQGEAKELDIADTVGGWVSNCEFSGRGTILIKRTGNGIVEISLEDGSVAGTYEEGSSLSYFQLAGNCLVAVSTDSIHYYDIETGKPMDDQEALTEQVSSDEKNLEIWSTTSFTTLFTAGDEENSLFYTDSNGVYRYVFGGSVVEQIIDGNLNSISSPDIAFVDMTVDAEGSLYLAVLDYTSGTGGGKIMKYEYSKDTPTVPDTELRVYTLTDNDFVRQVAAIFQKKYPDVYLDIDVGMTGDDAVTSTDALKTLNTEIMAGKGPDIILLDGIPDDTYVEKGMLMDISGILDGIESGDGLLENIKGAYTEEDGSVYRMPLKFGIPMLLGAKEEVDSITDLASFADVVESHAEEYGVTSGEIRMSCTLATAPGNLLKGLADVSAPAWLKEDGTLDEEAVSEYLEQANRIYQPGKEAMETFSEEYGVTIESDFLRTMYGVSTSATTVMGGYYVLGAGGLFSPYDLAMIDSAEKADSSLGTKLWNGQEENCFIPMEVIGISARAQETEAAEKFVEFLFSQDGQNIGKESGFPVNEAVYDSDEYWDNGVGETETIGSFSSENNRTGEMLYLEIYQPSPERIQEIRDLGRSLTKPSAANEIILNAVTEAGTAYLQGESTLEEAVSAVIQKVNLYLAE